MPSGVACWLLYPPDRGQVRANGDEHSAGRRSFLLEISACIIRALEEDIGPGDATTNSIVAPDAKMSGQIIAKQAGVVAGLDVARLVFRLLDEGVRFAAQV